MEIRIFTWQNVVESQRVAIVLHHVSNIAPAMFLGFTDTVIKVLSKPLQNYGPSLAMLRVLSMLNVPENSAGTIMDLAFKYLRNPKVLVAIEVSAMSLIAEQVKVYSELKKNWK